MGGLEARGLIGGPPEWAAGEPLAAHTAAAAAAARNAAKPETERRAAESRVSRAPAARRERARARARRADAERRRYPFVTIFRRSGVCAPRDKGGVRSDLFAVSARLTPPQRPR